MGSCILFCAAQFQGLLEPVSGEDFVIAADGGLRHTRELGLTPNEILGDFDSLGYVPAGSTVFPVEKDDTDCMLAVRRGLALGHRRFLIYGGMDGKRLDHTVANFQTLTFLAGHGAVGYLIGRDYIAAGFCGGTLKFDPGMQGDFSLFCPGTPAENVTIRGLYYGAENITLTPDFPIGVSNHFTAAPACVHTPAAPLLALWQTQTPLPEWLPD